jgi:ATP synthase F1 epsilon subunit
LNAAVSFLNLKKKYMSLQVSILTPEKPFWNGEAEEIILPTETGEMGILKNHAPIVTGLDVGAMLIKTKEEWSSVAIMGGFALVKKNKVTVLANEAQAAESIDPEEAKTAFETAKNNLEKAAGVKEKVEANFAYKRAKARYQVVKVVKKL